MFPFVKMSLHVCREKIEFTNSGPEVIKLFSCSTQLPVSTKFFLLMNVKMPTNVGILTFMSGKNSILGLSEPEKNLQKVLQPRALIILKCNINCRKLF